MQQRLQIFDDEKGWKVGLTKGNNLAITNFNLDDIFISNNIQ